MGRQLMSYIESSGYEVLGTQSWQRYPRLITFDLLKHRIQDRIQASFFDTAEPVYGVICAGVTKLKDCVQEREKSYKINVETTIRLIQDLLSMGAKPVFISSSFVFDGIAGYYGEDQPRSPVNVYGRHKVEVEDFIKSEAPGMLVPRLDKLVGTDPAQANMLAEWYGWMKQKAPITCIEGQVFSPTLVDDVAKAIVLGCQLGLTGIYNMANTEFFSREELAKQFVATLGGEAVVVAKPQEDFNFLERRPLKSYLDSTRFLKATGMRFISMREVFNSFATKTLRYAER